MAIRGEALREHILSAAKGVFLEMGFERASMDDVAARARTSKRSVYAHFESKEKLFLAVIDYVRELFLERLQSPESYSGKPVEALVQFCVRYLERGFLFEPSVQMLRMTLAETSRFPEAAAQHYDVVFSEPEAKLAAYLKTSFGLSTRASTEAAHRLLSRLLYPLVPRALAGLEDLVTEFAPGAPSPVDSKPVRKAVVELVESLPKRG